jgi:hypothetical protein
LIRGRIRHAEGRALDRFLVHLMLHTVRNR